MSWQLTFSFSLSALRTTARLCLLAPWLQATSWLLLLTSFIRAITPDVIQLVNDFLATLIFISTLVIRAVSPVPSPSPSPSPSFNLWVLTMITCLRLLAPYKVILQQYGWDIAAHNKQTKASDGYTWRLKNTDNTMYSYGEQDCFIVVVQICENPKKTF